MKKILMLSIIFLLLCNTGFASERYLWLNSTDKFSYFFDEQTIRYYKNPDGSRNPNIINVWIKNTYNQDGVNDCIKSRIRNHLLIDGWEDLDYSLTNYLFNLDKNSKKIMDSISYNKYGVKLETYQSSSKWYGITPNSESDLWIQALKEYAANNSAIMKNR